jgi:hypothetical protein
LNHLPGLLGIFLNGDGTHQTPQSRAAYLILFFLPFGRRLQSSGRH